MCARRTLKKTAEVAPDFMEKQRASMLRSRRQVVYFNEREMSAIEEYCRRLKIPARSSLYRKTIMKTVLSGLDEHHPTLFEQDK